MRLTAIQIKYMRVLYRLQDAEMVKLADVAEVLGVSKPSVHSMFRKLRRFGLISQDEHGFSHVTEFGKEMTERYEAQYQILFRFLREVLHLDENAAEENTLALLGGESDSSEELCRCVQQFQMSL